jgi:hypothetical protein
VELLKRIRRRSAGAAGGSVVQPSRDVLAAEQGGCVVLLDLRKEVYLGLDEAGTAVWREVEKGTAAPLIARQLHTEFDAPLEVLEADVSQFISELQSRGLVEGT